MNKIIKLSLIASMVTLSLHATEVEELSKKLNALQAQLDEVSDELEERIDEVETSTMTDKIKFGIGFTTRMDNFKNTTASGTEFSDNNIWSNRLRLNMSSKINDDMKFSGRLAMYKNWSDSHQYQMSGMDPMQGRRPSDSSLFVERAYIDWVVARGQVPIILTLGRQPSSDGPSHHFRDNTVRKATYSALSFDGAADGLVATFNLQKVSGVSGMALRVGYGKGFQEETGMSYVGNDTGVKDVNVLGVFFDTSLGMDGSLFQVSAVSATDITSGTSDSNGTNTNTNIGDMMLYTAMVEFTNIASTGLDIFAHYAISQAEPNGTTGNMATGDTRQPNAPMGLITNTPNDKSDKDGSAFWLGARYTLPLEALNNPRIGLEYNKGDENWFSFTQGSNDLTNKLATRGTAMEAYYIQPINRYAHLRFGATMIDYEYTNSGYQIGTPLTMAQAKMMNPNALDKLTNYYMMFNLTY